MAPYRSILKKFLLAICFLFILFVILALRPITTPYMKDCKSVTGVIQSIKGHEPSADINLRIGNGVHYYINRGLERGLTVESLKKEILNKEVILHYADHWTPLDPYDKVRHVSRITVENSIIYNEIKN